MVVATWSFLRRSPSQEVWSVAARGTRALALALGRIPFQETQAARAIEGLLPLLLAEAATEHSMSPES